MKAMKKTYNSPATLVVVTAPVNVICTSLAIDSSKTVDEALGRRQGNLWDDEDDEY